MSLLQSDTQLNRQSYYEASVQRPQPCAPLQGDVTVDVVVVGGGFAGLCAALDLRASGYTVALLEADRICSGASGRNGGQFIVGLASGQGPYEEQAGASVARQVWDMSLEAVALLQERVAQHGIECDLVKGYLTVADSPRKAKALHADAETLERDYGFATEWLTGDALEQHIRSPRYCAATWEGQSGHLHPLKYGLGLARAALAAGVRMFESSAVTGLHRGPTVRALTAGGSVSAKFAVLAGNCALPEFAPDVAPEISARIMPVGTYIIGTEPLDKTTARALLPGNAAVCDNNFAVDYFRFSADHRMLFGGGVSYSTATPANLKAKMAKRMAAAFPELKDVAVDYVWGGFVDISMSRAPDFGRLDSNIYYLQGFSGHGVALTGLAGRLVAQAIDGQAKRLDLFARIQHRRFPGGRLLRMPSLVLGMAYHQLKDLL
ncbi:MAG: FAD-binding oxidoreductase [Betaproteobacteria bacterium]|nr:FAD-binding oxidoreductase [Betaproteobacteria bacterium]